MKRCALIAALCTAALLSALFFNLIYKFDNKYTYSAPQAIGGVLLLDGASLEKKPVTFLRDGKEQTATVTLGTYDR